MSDKGQKMLGRFQAGDSFGEVSLIDQRARSATVEAESDMELLWIKREDFPTLTHRGDSPSMKLLNNFLHALCDKLRRTQHSLLLGEQGRRSPDPAHEIDS